MSQNDCRFKEVKLARLNTSAKRHNQTLHNQIVVTDPIRFVDVSELLVLDVFFFFLIAVRGKHAKLVQSWRF